MLYICQIYLLKIILTCIYIIVNDLIFIACIGNCTENLLMKNEQKRKKRVYHSLLDLKVKKF